MKQVLIVLLAASCAAAAAQTTAKPAASPQRATNSRSASGMKLPAGVPAVHSVIKTAFSLRYQEIKIGTGAEAEPDKLYKVHYTGWLAADGRKFDSSYDHPRPPVLDKDGKPVMGDDGKPKLGEPQPIAFPQGFGRVIPGFDQGFHGMKIGGKRRLFIPWQLAYGARGRPGPDAAHPGIPPKSDLIFDVELMSVSDIQMPPNHPGMGGMPGGRPMPSGFMPPGHVPVAPAKPAEPTAPATPTAPDKPSTSPQPQSN
ncbi:MAG TPA: FKBP-type peptidyl-prolyl cis-trans isomerase [Terracidiphilus sp.]|jgi:peptidylprolyl isomerase|nr:FKBP-type peptidyl-prolyl cis-trans isomerase [Terracidiphilus sp.]